MGLLSPAGAFFPTLNRSFIFRVRSRERVTLGISLIVMVSQRPLANLFSVSWVTCHLWHPSLGLEMRLALHALEPLARAIWIDEVKFA